MSKRFLICALLCFVLLLLAIAQSDDQVPPTDPPDPCATELTLDKLDNPPQRKTKLEVVEEIRKERLTDVKAADQKFVAVIRIKLPKVLGAPFDEANELDKFGRTANLELSPQWNDFIRLQSFATSI